MSALPWPSHPRDVRAWLSEMQAEGIPASSIRRRFSVFRKVMGDAVAMEMIVKTPCRGVTPPADTRLDITVLSAEEVSELAAAMPAWCRTWVYFAAYTGLRWSEMVGLARSRHRPLTPGGHCAAADRGSRLPLRGVR